jgi:hypothetical protein
VTLDKEAIDRIIHAVEHWADDIEDPVERTLNIEMEAMNQVLFEAWEKAHPDGPKPVKSKFWMKFQDRKKIEITTYWGYPYWEKS